MEPVKIIDDGAAAAPITISGGGMTEPATGPGSLEARRASLFGRPQPILTATAGGGGIGLRSPEARDVDAIVAACRDPQTVRWTTVPDPYQRSDGEFFAGTYAQGRWARGEGAVFVIADGADAYAGSIELRLSPTDPALADVGFGVAPAARGLGYASAALRALCAWGFTALGLARIEWKAHIDNLASRRVAEKAGFTIEGVQRAGVAHRGERRDVWVGSLLAADAAGLATDAPLAPAAGLVADAAGGASVVTPRE